MGMNVNAMLARTVFSALITAVWAIFGVRIIKVTKALRIPVFLAVWFALTLLQKHVNGPTFYLPNWLV